MCRYCKEERKVGESILRSAHWKKNTHILQGTLNFLRIKSPIELLLLKSSHCAALLLWEAPMKRKEGKEGGREGRHNVRTGWKTASANSGTPHRMGPLYICHTISGHREGFILKVAMLIYTECILVHQVALGKSPALVHLYICLWFVFAYISIHALWCWSDLKVTTSYV